MNEKIVKIMNDVRLRGIFLLKLKEVKEQIALLKSQEKSLETILAGLHYTKSGTKVRRFARVSALLQMSHYCKHGKHENEVCPKCQSEYTRRFFLPKFDPNKK